MLTMRPSTTPDVNLILQTIRQFESGGNYTNKNRSSSASGAYQYLDSTWNGYGGYTHAKDAPPAVQDQRARQDVQRILQSYGGDVTAIPQVWYYPAGYGKPNLVPPGNSLSMGEYTAGWMRIYNSLGGTQGGGSTAISVGAGVPATGQLASTTGGDSGGFQEHCLLKLPSANLNPLPVGPDLNVGGGCLFASNQARAVGGALLTFLGGSIVLVGMSLLVLGRMPVSGIVPGGAFITNMSNRQRANEGMVRASRPPRTTVEGERMMGRSVTLDDGSTF